MSPAAHELVSMHLLQPLRWLYRLARPSLRGAALESGEGLRFRERTDAWSLDQRREWMRARLRETVRRASWTTPYNRGLFDELGFEPRGNFAFDDFAALPPLQSVDVQRVGRALVSVAVPPDEAGSLAQALAAAQSVKHPPGWRDFAAAWTRCR
jgi:hypothetical protein